MSIAKGNMAINLIGASGVGKSTFGAALTVKKHLAQNKNGDILIKDLNNDELFVNIRENINKQFPTKHRIVHKSRLKFKGKDNAWPIVFSEIFLYDDRGGSFDSFLQLFYNPDECAIESSALFANSIIVMISTEQFFKSCPKYEMGCTPIQCQNCKEKIDKTADIDCKHLNRYAVKQMLHVVAKISIKNNIPVAIAVTHSDVPSKERLNEIRVILSEYLFEEYASMPRLRPNIYFIDSKSAIENPKSKWASTVTLPILDVMLKSLENVALNQSKNKVTEFFQRQMWGARKDIYSELKDTMITAIETQGDI